MKRVHIIGRKNSGKTTLVVELVGWLTSQDVRVGTIKHTHHQHELDTPGKDSHRHRGAGAAVVGILSPGLNAVFSTTQQQHDAADRYERIAPMFDDCDLVIVEGHSLVAAPKVEVWRAVNGQPPLAATDGSILAVVTDDPVTVDVPVLPRHDVPGLAARLLAWTAVKS